MKPVLDFTTLLLHGLRAIRYHYATRMSFFISCVKLHMHQPEAVPHPLVPAARSPSDRFSAWCSTPAGQGVLQQLRWLAPTQPILVARLQAERGTVPASSQARWVSLSQSRGVPIRTGTSLSWGFHLSWDDAKSLLHTRCTCDLLPGPIPALCLCPTCGKAQIQSASTETLPCVWCGQTGPCVCISCRRTIHFRPHCGRWNCGAHQAYAPPQTTPSASAQTVPTPGCTLQLPLQSVCSAPLFRESSGSTSPRLQIAHSRCRSQCRSANRPQLPSHQTLAPSLPPEALGAHPCFNHSHRLSICFCRCS